MALTPVAGSPTIRAMSASWQVIAAPAPPASAGADWEWTWVYEGLSRIRHDREQQTWGYTDRWAPTPVAMAFLTDSPYRRTVLRVAVREHDGAPTADDVLGVARVTFPLDGDAHVGFVDVDVDPHCEGQGIGTALADVAEKLLDQEARTTTLTWTVHAPEPEPGPGVVTAPTGSGRVDLADPRARFATSRGFRLEQVARASTLTVQHIAPAEVERLRVDAAAHAGPDYRVHTWNRTVPEQYHAALAALWGRMSTDAPTGAVDIPDEEWDADRVAGRLDDLARAYQQCLLAAAEHVPSGTLAAFTLLSVPEPDVEFGFQEDTLVLPEHRGRRLGMLVKATNLQQLAALRANVRRLHTVNAEENAFMLAINVALGYRGAGVIATWQKQA